MYQKPALWTVLFFTLLFFLMMAILGGASVLPLRAHAQTSCTQTQAFESGNTRTFVFDCGSLGLWAASGYIAQGGAWDGQYVNQSAGKWEPSCNCFAAGSISTGRLYNESDDPLQAVLKAISVLGTDTGGGGGGTGDTGGTDQSIIDQLRSVINSLFQRIVALETRIAELLGGGTPPVTQPPTPPTVSPGQIMAVSLHANPSSGNAPFTTQLTATTVYGVSQNQKVFAKSSVNSQTASLINAVQAQSSIQWECRFAVGPIGHGTTISCTGTNWQCTTTPTGTACESPVVLNCDYITAQEGGYRFLYDIGNVGHDAACPAQPPQTSPPSGGGGGSGGPLNTALNGRLYAWIVIDANGNGEWDYPQENLILNPVSDSVMMQRLSSYCTSKEFIPGFRVNLLKIGSSSPISRGINTCHPKPLLSELFPQGYYTTSLTMPSGWQIVGMKYRHPLYNFNSEINKYNGLKEDCQEKPTQNKCSLLPTLPIPKIRGLYFAGQSSMQIELRGDKEAPSSTEVTFYVRKTGGIDGGPGTTQPTVNYTFWWNCSYTGANVQTAISQCGNPDGASGNANGNKFDGVTSMWQTSVPHTYFSPGIYTAKVIVESGSVAVETRRKIQVLSTEEGLPVTDTEVCVQCAPPPEGCSYDLRTCFSCGLIVCPSDVEPDQPFIDLKVNNSDGPVTIANNSSATISWTSDQTTTCFAYGDWFGLKSTSGSQVTGNINGVSKTYSIACYSFGTANLVYDSVTVNVSP